MGRPEPPRVLLLVEPDLLGQLLARILAAVGEDEVTNVPHREPVPSSATFSVAVVSAPLAQEGVAELIIELPGAGESIGLVHTPTSEVSVEMTGPYAVLEALDRFCPAARRRTLAASNWRVHDDVGGDGV